ncbi:hypothetical protein P8625_06845 [Tenacibaculum tangerinum]|uniref:Bacteriocin n=1 Tax=Tenacibaculum tangerinum TaxID=3038772 RepID=A0ABY8L633_9FLAO|nr:hypothetical protein [Tenacibaculum tangerinum]WGH76853.1 hypothetical protein P8625_06845 [Tenacibaculum tangerinum]
MKKQISNLGTVLDKTTQKLINGGDDIIGFCDYQGNCPAGSYCENDFCVKDHSSGGGPGGGGSGCINPHRFCENEYDTCCYYA